MCVCLRIVMRLTVLILFTWLYECERREWERERRKNSSWHPLIIYFLFVRFLFHFICDYYCYCFIEYFIIWCALNEHENKTLQLVAFAYFLCNSVSIFTKEHSVQPKETYQKNRWHKKSQFVCYVKNRKIVYFEYVRHENCVDVYIIFSVILWAFSSWFVSAMHTPSRNNVNCKISVWLLNWS